LVPVGLQTLGGFDELEVPTLREVGALIIKSKNVALFGL
jgi:hypothetical protein